MFEKYQYVIDLNLSKNVTNNFETEVFFNLTNLELFKK